MGKRRRTVRRTAGNAAPPVHISMARPPGLRDLARAPLHAAEGYISRSKTEMFHRFAEGQDDARQSPAAQPYPAARHDERLRAATRVAHRRSMAAPRIQSAVTSGPVNVRTTIETSTSVRARTPGQRAAHLRDHAGLPRASRGRASSAWIPSTSYCRRRAPTRIGEGVYGTTAAAMRTIQRRS